MVDSHSFRRRTRSRFCQPLLQRQKALSVQSWDLPFSDSPKVVSISSIGEGPFSVNRNLVMP